MATQQSDILQEHGPRRPVPRFDDYAWKSRDHLDHIPGEDGLPLLGNTFVYLRDQLPWAMNMYRKHGPVFINSAFMTRVVNVCTPDAAIQMLRDRDQLFSSLHGWDVLIGRYFGGGLMLRDFDDHRLHRRVMQEAFKKYAIAGYLDLMNPICAEQIPKWGQRRRLKFYPTIKKLTLDMAGVIFTGLPLGEEIDRVNDAFVAMMKGSFAMVRLEIPGSSFWRGARARDYLHDLLRELIPKKRAGNDSDMLAQLCHAVSDEGERLNDEEIIDHMIFLMLAAHDTTTSALTNMCWALGAHPEWQERLRDQFRAIGKEHLDYDDLEALEDVDLCLKETLRLHPPVSAIPRLALRDCEIEGVFIPKDTVVWLQTLVIHRLPEYWTRPDVFDPERFSDERAEHKQHPGQYHPYSSGPHICLGMHFSTVQVKAVLNRMLREYRLVLPEGYAPKQQVIPFPKPMDDLPLTLEPLASPWGR